MTNKELATVKKRIRLQSHTHTHICFIAKNKSVNLRKYHQSSDQEIDRCAMLHSKFFDMTVTNGKCIQNSYCRILPATGIEDSLTEITTHQKPKHTLYTRFYMRQWTFLRKF